MRRLDSRVAIVTGAGSGLGRAHALRLAAGGAVVVVNDLGSDVYGDGKSSAPAARVVEEIEAGGGRAVTSAHDIADWEQAAELVQTALDAFGRLDVLVNNAGIVADRTLANLTAADWDSVIRVHLTGHAAPTAHAMRHWRNRAKAGDNVKASVVHTSSVAGFSGNFGQANYSAAKAGVIGLSKVVSIEGRSIGVRSNVISPSARTRMAATVPGSDSLLTPPSDPTAFDVLDPANVSPLVAWLAEADCPADDQIFHLIGNRLYVLRMPCVEHTLVSDGRWTPDQFDAQLLPRLVDQLPIETFFEGLATDRVPAS
jgi:NAD(P)-dependent dehydrogenase (short-subunit alcohol dehydrogenase family)